MPAEPPDGVKYAPALATLVSAPPVSDDYAVELKYDGYRMGLVMTDGRVRWKSRHGKDWTHAFPELVDAAAQLAGSSLVLDGEVAVLLPSGLTSFHELQNALKAAPDSRQLVFFAFDVLFARDRDVRNVPLEDRKELLRELLLPLPDTAPIRYVDHIIGDGARVFAEAARLGAEGIVSKRRRSVYRAGRTRDWLKSKCVRTQDFVVCGYRDRQSSRSRRGWLLLGYHDAAGRLRYAGSVGTGKGFTRELVAQLRLELGALRQPKSPFDDHSTADPHTHWVRPLLVVEVGFTEWTSSGELRHPSVQRFRPEVRPEHVVTHYPRYTDVDRITRWR